MTVAEEVGLAGAADLDPELISGTALLNLDSEEDGAPHRRLCGRRRLDPAAARAHAGRSARTRSRSASR